MSKIAEQAREQANKIRESDKIILRKICPRFTNKFIYNEKKAVALKNSIKNIGLQQPIDVVEIEGFLNANKEKLSADEIKYLETMQNEYNCKYFISGGHRRYRAYLELLLNETSYPYKNVKNKNEIMQFFEGLKNENIFEPELKNLIGEGEKWKKIKCQISTPSVEQEKKIYAHTNLTNRSIETFENVVNALDEMEDKNPSAADIQRYLEKEYGAVESLSNISHNLAIIRRINDERFINEIYDGNLTIKNAKALTSFFDKKGVTDKHKEAMLKDIKEKKFDVAKWKEKIFPKKAKAGAYQSKNVSRAIALDYAYKIKSGIKTIDEMIEWLNEK